MNPISDESYFDLLIDNNLLPFYTNHANTSYPLNPKVSLLPVEEKRFQMSSLGEFPYSSFPSLFTLSSEVNVHSNIDKIQSNPNFALYGQGVLVGIIDTGIDYQHPAFRYPDGSSRVLSLWDQTIDSALEALPPDLFYGSCYTNDQINAALLNDNPLSLVPSVDEVGHGTMVAGIAGGNDNSGTYRGIVPECSFLIVKLKPAKRLNKKIFCIPEDQLCFEESDVIAALTFLTNMSRILMRPLSICLAMGTSQGGHNGKGSTSGYLNYITQSPHMDVSVAAGNEGSLRRHYFGHINSASSHDFELNISEKDTSFSMEIWVTPPYRISLDITTPNGENFRGFYPRINESRRLSCIFIPAVIWINNIASESDTGDQMILIRFETAFKGIWRFRATSIDKEPATFHAWLPSGSLISPDTFFLNSDSDTTLTSPGNADSPLVVTNLDDSTGAVSPDSSRGYTRYNVIKPDLAAPGSEIPAPSSLLRYGTLSGTGASAAHAAGVVAMILEWAVVQGRHSTITGSDINHLLIRGASRSRQNEYPNPAEGYGIMDIYGMFEKLI